MRVFVRDCETRKECLQVCNYRIQYIYRRGYGKKRKKKMIEDGKDVSIRDKIKRDRCTNHDDLSNGKILAT